MTATTQQINIRCECVEVNGELFSVIYGRGKKGPFRAERCPFIEPKGKRRTTMRQKRTNQKKNRFDGDDDDDHRVDKRWKRRWQRHNINKMWTCLPFAHDFALGTYSLRYFAPSTHETKPIERDCIRCAGKIIIKYHYGLLRSLSLVDHINNCWINGMHTTAATLAGIMPSFAQTQTLAHVEHYMLVVHRVRRAALKGFQFLQLHSHL